ncbi:hypothetical protein K0817_007650 [Microbacterium sp. HD4P20]|uniref:hypothetical protein n=1 Tax=Microbacterium sp. HD4P20 TaxID=2864874 RepID=UPI001C640507|nr:hypothetical protein [Microbacterium sp. HD4P20]MCP2636444.1 hypothetical protein [Microbacterium sp. HD4P20]
MIATFLRPPSGIGEWLADAVRALGVASVVAAFTWWTVTDAGILALTLPALVLPRFVGVRPGFDVIFGVTVLVAAWSNLLGLYRTWSGWDLAVHFVCTGVFAAMLYLLLARLDVVPAPREPDSRRRTPIVIVAALGLAISAVWEMVEWAGKTFVTDEIFVTYQDTIGDMAVGGLGAVAAGVTVAIVRLEKGR